VQYKSIAKSAGGAALFGSFGKKGGGAAGFGPVWVSQTGTVLHLYSKAQVQKQGVTRT
jgi:hypothetical protein